MGKSQTTLVVIGEQGNTMNKKYKLGDKHPTLDLWRVVALRDFGDVKKGAVGGWIATEDNLSQYGKCWIYDDVMVYEEAEIGGDALIYGKMKICGETGIYGNTHIRGDAEIWSSRKYNE